MEAKARRGVEISSGETQCQTRLAPNSQPFKPLSICDILFNFHQTGCCAMEDRLTVIITTSPVPTAPSTELLTTVLDSFSKHCPQLLECSVIVTIDTFDKAGNQARLKKGRVSHQTAGDFELYTQNVKQLILDRFTHDKSPELECATSVAEFGSPFKEENTIPTQISSTSDGRVTFIEPQARIGFSLAVKSALEITTREYVWIHQHDWTLQTDVPIASMINVMQSQHSDAASPVRYIGLPSIRLLKYAEQSDNVRYLSFRKLTQDFKRPFEVPSKENADAIPLTPFFFWQDKPHVASKEHYMQRIFPSRMATKRGAFIEDTVGQKARTQMKENPEQFKKWATWLYYPDDGKELCLRHLDGRVWKGTERELLSIDRWRSQGRQAV